MKYLKYFESVNFEEEHDWEEEPEYEPGSVHINPKAKNYYVEFSFYFGDEGVEYEDLPEYEKLKELLEERYDDFGDYYIEDFTNVLQLSVSICQLIRHNNEYEMQHLDFNIIDPGVNPLDENGNIKEFIEHSDYPGETLFVYVGNTPHRINAKNVCEQKSNEIRRELLNPRDERQWKIDLRFDEEMLDGQDALRNYLYFDLSDQHNSSGPYKLIEDW